MSRSRAIVACFLLPPPLRRMALASDETNIAGSLVVLLKYSEYLCHSGIVARDVKGVVYLRG